MNRVLKGQLQSTQYEARRQDYLTTATGDTLTPESLVAACQDANAGRPLRLLELQEEAIDRDLHLQGILQTRRSSLSGKSWVLKPGRGRVSTPPDVMDATEAMLRELLDDQFYGRLQGAVTDHLVAHEITWDVSSGQAQPVSLDWVHAKRFIWNTTTSGVQVAGDPGGPMQLGELRLVTDEQPMWGERLIRNKWLIHQLPVRNVYPWRLGNGRTLTWYEIFKVFDWKNWAIWLELCAIPMRIAELEAGQEADRAVVEEAMEIMGSAGWAVLNKLAKLTIVSGNNGGDQSYERKIRIINEEMSKGILGHMGSADTTPGKLGSTTTADDIRQDLVESDSTGADGTVNRQLIRPFIRFNWGPEVTPPEVALQVERQATQDNVLSRAERLWKIGYPIGRRWIRETQGIPEADNAADALPAPGPQGMATNPATDGRGAQVVAG